MNEKKLTFTFQNIDSVTIPAFHCHHHHDHYPHYPSLAKHVLTRAVPPEFQSLVSVEGGEVGFDQQRIYFLINHQRVLYLLSRGITNIYCWSHQGGEGEWSRCNFCHTLAFEGHIVSQVHWKHLNMFMCQNDVAGWCRFQSCLMVMRLDGRVLCAPSELPVSDDKEILNLPHCH